MGDAWTRISSYFTGRGRGRHWLASELWRQLGLTEFWRQQLPEGREAVSWEKVLRLLVVNRLLEPGSEFRICPRTVRGRIPLLMGGQPQYAVHRVVRWGSGFTIGGAPPEMAAGMIEGFRAAWAEAGGEGSPRVVALSYFSLGDEHAEESLHNLRTYYGYAGDWAENIAAAAPRTPDAVRDRVAALEELGVDELVFDPTVADADQVDRLADVIGRT